MLLKSINDVLFRRKKKIFLPPIQPKGVSSVSSDQQSVSTLVKNLESTYGFIVSKDLYDKLKTYDIDKLGNIYRMISSEII